MQSRVTKRSRKLPSNSVNHRSALLTTQSPDQKQLFTPRQRIIGRQKTKITAPGVKKRQLLANSPTLETNEQQNSSLSNVSPSNTTKPRWLIRFFTLYRYSCLGTFLLVVAVLVVYGWTVYSQKLWGQNYRKLQELQRDERQLTKTNEVLKNKMAQEAEKPNAGLLSPTPNKTIFLPGEQLEVNQNGNADNTHPQRQPAIPSSLGY
ncbi:MAG: hypothetical protein QNJ36_17575 [Calothrix sp. MO_167.B42]|nr:hypothetical protein [Calothrix sp. MO_167.B42]